MNSEFVCGDCVDKSAGLLEFTLSVEAKIAEAEGSMNGCGSSTAVELTAVCRIVD